MSWLGFYSLNGTEVVNGPRFEAYARNAGKTGKFRPYFKFPELADILGDARYRSPLQDIDVPWTDPNDPDTYNFYGFFPTACDGIDSSTRSSTIVEFTGDGGSPGRLRHTTKQMVFTGFLMGADDAAVDAGMRWFRAALLSGSIGGCADGGCDGAQLCYLYAEPKIGDDTDESCLDPYLRYLYNVVVNVGPTVTQKNVLGDGTTIWQVTFTAVAGIPWEFGSVVPVVTGFPALANYFAPSTADEAGRIIPETACPNPIYNPVFDPACPQLILPPIAPAVPIGCFDPPQNWRRFSFTIDPSLIPDWTDMVPLIVSNTRFNGLRNLRVRIYPSTIDVDAQSCSYCADFLVSYQPSESVLTIDGRTETITVLNNGQLRRADSLVFGSDSTPFQWPSLSCGIGYTVTIDTLQTASSPGGPFGLPQEFINSIDFSLVPRNR